MQNTLYITHLNVLLQRYREALIHFKLDAIVISSGSVSYYYHDDNSHPFKPYAGAQQWLPFDLPSDCFIVIKHDKPELIWPAKQDFWHQINAIPEGDWQKAWRLTPVNNDKWCQALPSRCALIGPATLSNVAFSDALETWLNYDRAIKTEYEIECISRASKVAVKGHVAAQNAFLSGASEFEIHCAYLSATLQDSAYTPYPNIVGINEHAATLHYEHKDRNRAFRPLTLLVDAGASEFGYASDITRTTTVLDDDFTALKNDIDRLQQTIASKAVAGKSFIDLHNEMLLGTATVLRQHDICRLSTEEQIDKRIPHHFIPHGLGHLLGLQVHDVGGRQTDRDGSVLPAPTDSPFLRLTRTLQENMVITIEPGLYFIPMLLDQLKANTANHGCNVNKIEQLIPYGGIRIEDNVVVGVENVNNLTRHAFAEL